MSLDYAHKEPARAGLLPFEPATLYYFAVVGSSSLLWGSLRGVWGWSITGTAGLLAVVVGLLMWLRREASDDDTTVA